MLSFEGQNKVLSSEKRVFGGKKQERRGILLENEFFITNITFINMLYLLLFCDVLNIALCVKRVQNAPQFVARFAHLFC